MDEPILRTLKLSKRFGGLAAVNEVSIDLWMGKVHAVIGPNGAGKTTLTNLLSGDLPPTGGNIHYRGQDIAGHSSDRISRLGIGRSYQKTNIFHSFTAFENCRLAAQSRRPHPFRILRSALRYQDVNATAQKALALAGLEHRANKVASMLSHGEQRQLEIAMTLATDPQVLLLDEPLAGMGALEAERMVGLLQNLAKSHAVLLIEHDMDAVFAVADVLTVMVNGCVLESGTPEQIRNSPQVQEAYLGKEEAHAD